MFAVSVCPKNIANKSMKCILIFLSKYCLRGSIKHNLTQLVIPGEGGTQSTHDGGGGGVQRILVQRIFLG